MKIRLGSIKNSNFFDFVSFVRNHIKRLKDLFYLFIYISDCIYALYDKTDKMTKLEKAHK